MYVQGGKLVTFNGASAATENELERRGPLRFEVLWRTGSAGASLLSVPNRPHNIRVIWCLKGCYRRFQQTFYGHAALSWMSLIIDIQNKILHIN